MSETTTTNGIRITVKPSFVANQSNPQKGLFIYTYHICIENCSSDIVRLMSRYWRITDSQGRSKEVEGDGVIGKQPVLYPEARYEYESWAPLATDFGTMSGYFVMLRLKDNSTFKAQIPQFPLVPDYRMN